MRRSETIGKIFTQIKFVFPSVCTIFKAIASKLPHLGIKKNEFFYSALEIFVILSLGSKILSFGFSQINLENPSLNRNFETASSLEDRLHLGKTQIKFGFSLGLHYLCPHLLIHYIFL